MKEPRISKGITIHKKVCPVCENIFKTRLKNQKSCSYECGRILMHINNPELKDFKSKNFTKQLKALHENGKAYKMPKGKHTQEFKDKASIRAKNPKSEETKNRIKENHWSNKEDKEDVIDRLLETRRNNPTCNTEEYKNKLKNYVKDNPDCVKSHKRYKVGYYLNKHIEDMEYHHSGYELRFMKFLDKQGSVIFWTKKHKIFIEYQFNGNTCEYWPDFLVMLDDGRTLLIELKGYEEDADKLSAKILAGQNYCIEHSYIYKIIFQKDKNGFDNFSCE